MAGIKKVFSQEELKEFKTYRMKIWCVCECVNVSVYVCVCVRERENGNKGTQEKEVTSEGMKLKGTYYKIRNLVVQEM